MATTTKARSRRKPERRIRLIKPIQDGMGALQITVGGEPHNYLIYTLHLLAGLLRDVEGTRSAYQKIRGPFAL
jgi:hypothetical protein